jgi:hypothetical protein
MTTTFRSILGAAIMAMGSLAAVLVIENQAFAGDSVCMDTGCAGRSGFGTRDCNASGGGPPCFSGPGVQCSCKEHPFNNVECYCNGTVS